jgi:hypothetical protein
MQVAGVRPQSTYAQCHFDISVESALAKLRMEMTDLQWLSFMNSILCLPSVKFPALRGLFMMNEKAFQRHLAMNMTNKSRSD